MIVKSTFHKYSISRKKMFNVARKSPTPNVNKSKITNAGINIKKLHDGMILQKISTPTITIKLMAKIMKLYKTFESGYKSFGTYTLVSIPAWSRIERQHPQVPFVKKVKNNRPIKMYIGYVGLSFLNKVPNTITKMIVLKIGSIKLHKIPKYERLYFKRIPFLTNSESKKL